MVQALIDETYQKFKSIVQTGRDQAHDKNKENSGVEADKGRALSDSWQEYADGRVLSGTQALKLGLVDQLGSFDVAVARAKAIAGISSANLVEYQQRYDLSDFFHMFGQSESRVVKLDLGLEPPKLQAGQLYFLAPTFAH